MENPIVAAIALVAAAALGALAVKLLDRLRRKDVESEAQRILEQARHDAAQSIKEADIEIKAKTLETKTLAEREIDKLRDDLRQRERQIDRRNDLVEQQAEDLQRQKKLVESGQRKLTEKMEETARRETELTKLIDLERRTLHEISGLDREEATKRVLGTLEDELSHESGTMIVRHRKRMEQECDRISREMLLTTMQRYAASHTAESTTSTIDIPSDEMKGRIIGREGRNIRAFEKETGVDVIIDDTPGVVIVSGFDPVRREIARLSLEKLIADGRIHPSRIEELVAETQKEIEKLIQRKGEEAAQEADVQNLHPKLIYMLGRLHYRTSYSQNVLRHSIEVSFLSGMIAELLGMDATLGRRAGLLHDIGKAVDHEVEGGHPKIGADLLKRHGENDEVVHAAKGHHDEIVIEHPYTVLVATADACSASRPGARRETLERYIKRMEELESIAASFEGVDQAFAIQAGRELRVIASSKNTNDAKAAKICRDIAKAFEERLTYPGEIKITVVRESRFTEIAR